jgi:hypothetical protein
MGSEEVDAAFESAEDSWAPIIGKFILEFGSVEECLHSVIFGPVRGSQVSVSGKEDRLVKKLQLFQRIVGEKLDEQDVQSKLKECVDGLGKLIRTRNLLAHNSLALEFWETEEGVLKIVGPVIYGRKCPTFSVTFDVLTLQLKELKRYRKIMYEVLGAFHSACR